MAELLEAPADPDRFEEAIRAFRKRIPVTPEMLAHMDAAARGEAFVLANVTEARVVQEVFDAIDRAIEEGTTFTDFRDTVENDLEVAWGEPDGARLETIFRTEVMRSYNEGRDEVFNDPDVREARPFWRFDAVPDSHICDTCEPLDGVVRPADDDFWDTHKPPLHPNCRCVLAPLTQEEAVEEGADADLPDAEEPSDGFGSGEPYRPDLEMFAPEIAAVLREKLGSDD